MANCSADILDILTLPKRATKTEGFVLFRLVFFLGVFLLVRRFRLLFGFIVTGTDLRFEAVVM